MAFLIYSSAARRLNGAPLSAAADGAASSGNPQPLTCSLAGWSGVATAIVLVACAMLCKEQGITVLGVCLVYDACIVNKVKRVLLCCRPRSRFTWRLSEQLCGEQLVGAVRASLGMRPPSATSASGKTVPVAARCCGGRSLAARALLLVASALGLLAARVCVMGSQLPVFTR